MTLREFDYEKEPVVSIVKKILTDAVKMKVSDIHFDPTNIELSIKFRINGNLQEYTTAPESVKTNITTRIKILSNMNITDSMHPQTGTINFEVEGKHHDLRVSSLPVCDGEKLVLSIHNYENNIKSLSKMGLNPVDTEKIKKLVKSNQGLVLITGTTSSGKTTTMYAMLKEIQSKSLNIISIEDPVKLKIDGINQVEIAPDKGITYKSALKHVMLQDPNIICIDDLINDEIAREAIRASITGRLVISSIYTKNAYTTIDNLLNMDIENYLLGANLNGIISQRLVKQLCPKCKEKRYTTEYEKTIIKKLLNKDVQELYYPKGCEECHNGYVGQIPIVEVVEITDEIRSAITNKKDRKTIRELLYKDNTPIIINGFNKVLEGTTSFNEIIRITDVKIDLDESQNDIKEYILGNTTTIETTNEIKVEEPTKVEDIPNSEVQVVEQKEEPTPVLEEQPKEIKEEVVEVQEPTPVVVKETEPVVEQVVEAKQEEPTPVVEETPVVEPQPVVEETTPPTPPKQMPTEGRRIIEEVNELFSDDVEEFNILAEILNDDTTEEIPTNEEQTSEIQTEVQQPTPAPVETEEPKEETVETVEETPVTEEFKEEVTEEPTKVEKTVQQEINVPAPIEANVVEEKPTPIEEDEDDEDDFAYGEEYENSF